MSKAAWIIFISIIIAVLGGLVIYSRLNAPTTNVSILDNNKVIAASKDNGNIADHVFGKSDSKVLLIEYGDFQCPSCGKAHPQIKEISEEYKGKIAFIFRNFPLTTIHPNARAAAAAVEAAGLQGVYWEMHNLVFESQEDWSGLTGSDRTNMFVGYATSLGLNKDKFLADLASESVNQKISFDQALGKKLNVNATPTFYLDGTKVSDEVTGKVVNGSTAELKALIDAAIK